MAEGRLTTHVLDTAAGRPAAGLRIELWSVRPDGARDLVREAVTNDDGRIDGALLSGAAFVTGSYELVFHAGDYLRAAGHAARVRKLRDEALDLRRFDIPDGRVTEAVNGAPRCGPVALERVRRERGEVFGLPFLFDLAEETATRDLALVGDHLLLDLVRRALVGDPSTP